MHRAALNYSTSKTPQTGADSTSIPTAELERLTKDYLLDCDYRMQSPQTIATRRVFLERLLWFLQHRRYANCGTTEVRQFLSYLMHGHEEPGGRWGNPRFNKPVRPITVKDYYVNLKCFFNWLMAEAVIEASPMARVPKPRVQTEQVEPFSQQQINALLKAARHSQNPRRDEAIVLFLYDTGVRASELCGLKLRDIDLSSRHAYVLGKGNKHRLVYFSRETGKALSNYLRKPKRELEDPVFVTKGNAVPGQPLTVSGLRQIIERLGQAAGIQATKVSPHVFRHSAAIQLLRNGCDVYGLMSLMGHTSLTICQSYLKLSKLDLENQHRRCSPVDALTRSKGQSGKPR
jgi:site-specific recombinase XerD